MKNDCKKEQGFIDFWLFGGGAITLALIFGFMWMFSLGPFNSDYKAEQKSKIEQKETLSKVKSKTKKVIDFISDITD